MNTFRIAIVTAALFGGLIGVSRADFMPQFTGATDNGNGTTTYTYSLNLSDTERADPTGTSSNNPPGTFVTIYDFNGLTGVGTLPADWTFSIQNTGITPSLINGSAFDDPTVPNVTFTYSGPVVDGPATFSGFQIISSIPFNTLRYSHYTSQATDNTPGLTNGNTDQAVGSVAVPVALVPEPSISSLVCLAAAVAGLRTMRRRHWLRISAPTDQPPQ